jgi:ankyrin repeat protein
MIKKGASVNAVNDNGETPIFSAIFNDAIRALLIEKLIEHGADINVLSSFNEGILHYAVRMGRSVLSFLEKKSGFPFDTST